MSNILQGLNKTQAHDGVFLLTESRTYKLWESAGQKISEAQLTADQINQIFQQVEQGATAAGGNRTMLGKGKDAAGAVNKAWEELKTKVQDSGPIKGVDAMYDSAAEKLKQATGGDEGVMKYVQKYRDFAKKHPVAQGLIYSALIAAAGISGAGVGGAAALGLFKMVDKLLQGEKFSSAAYQGGKTGAMAYGASKLADYVKGKPEGGAGGTDAAAGTPIKGARGLADEADRIFREKVANGEVTDYNSYQQGMQDSVDQALQNAGGKMSFQSQETARMILKAKLDNVVAQGNGGQFTGSGPEKAAELIKQLGGQVNTDTVSQQTSAAAQMAQSNAASSALNTASNTAGVSDVASNLASNIPPQTIEQPTIKVRGQPVDVPGGMSGVGALDPSIAPIGANGEPMRAVPMDEPVTGRTGRMPGATQPGINRLTGKPFELAPSWDQMTPDQQAAVTARQLQQAADAAQGAENAKQYWANKPANTRGLKESFAESNNESTILSESQIFLIIGKIVERQRKLDEGIMDTVKGAAGKAMNWAQTKGTNLTTKVTADKLLQAWKKAGSPTDSLDVASIIQKAGVPSDSIKQVYTTMQIPFAGKKGAGASTKRNIDVDPSSVAPGAPTSAPTASAPSATANAPAADASQAAPTGPFAQVQELIAKLDPETKEKVISTLKQELSVAESKDEYGPEYQAMVQRVGQMAKQGERKTVWDPVKRVYKTVPVNTPKDKEVDEAFNNYHANRTGFTRPKRDLSGEGEPEGMFMVMIDGRPWKEFTSNIAFQRAKTLADKNPSKKIQVKWPSGQLNTVTSGTEAPANRAVDANGRTQAQWAQLVMSKFPGAKITQAKMIDGPMQATLPDGRKIGWKKVEQIDEIIDPSTKMAWALRHIAGFLTRLFPYAVGAGTLWAASGLLAPLVAASGGVTAAISALGGSMGSATGAAAGAVGGASIMQIIKNLFAADENSIQAGIKKWVERQVGDEADVQEFLLTHAKAAYDGKPGFRWRAKEWPVKLSKDQAEAYLEKKDKSWLDYEKQKVIDAEKAKAEKDKEGMMGEQLDELNCWSGYHRVAGTKAGFPGSCAKNKTNEEGVAEEEDKMDSRFKKTEWMPLMDAIKILKHYGATPEKYMGHEMFPYYDIEGNRKYLEDITWNADNSKNVRVSLVNQAVRELKAQKQGMAEGQHSCPHCGGEMVSEELMNEKKDACYYKVKSRYKVWPSAYASGALVKCRKSGADSWGNGGKKNEGSILEGINRADESLHDWFNKEKWVRMDTKGKIKGPCAREPGEGKPKCLPQAKAHSLGKKGRASAAARKRREDPNPERSGKAINVNTKKKD